MARRRRDSGREMRWARRGAYGLAVLALAVVSGLAPGDSARATIDHCYVRNHDWEPAETKCIGHWTLLGHTFTGPVYGVDVLYHWHAIPQAPTTPGWNEVTAPYNARHPPALVAPGGSLVTWLVWFVRAALVVVVVVPVLLAATRRRCRSSSDRRPTAIAR